MYGIDKWRSTSGRLLPTGQQKIDESETGYYLVAEVVNILCDEKYLAEDGKPDVEKMKLITFDPVHHLIFLRHKNTKNLPYPIEHGRIFEINYNFCLFNSQPNCFTLVFSLHDFLFQAMNPDATVEHFADFAVLANEDAAFGVCGGVTRMDSDALPFAVELRATEQDGKPLLELGREGDDYRVAAFGNGRAAFHLVGTVLVVAPSGFEGVAEIPLGCAS